MFMMVMRKDASLSPHNFIATQDGTYLPKCRFCSSKPWCLTHYVITLHDIIIITMCKQNGKKLYVSIILPFNNPSRMVTTTRASSWWSCEKTEEEKWHLTSHLCVCVVPYTISKSGWGMTMAINMSQEVHTWTEYKFFSLILVIINGL